MVKCSSCNAVVAVVVVVVVVILYFSCAASAARYPVTDAAQKLSNKQLNNINEII
jgi:hypothetical protein